MLQVLHAVSIMMKCLWGQVKLLFCSSGSTTPTCPILGKTESIFVSKYFPCGCGTRPAYSIQLWLHLGMQQNTYIWIWKGISSSRKTSPLQYYEQNSKILPPGYNRLHVKKVQYQKMSSSKFTLIATIWLCWPSLEASLFKAVAIQRLLYLSINMHSFLLEYCMALRLLMVLFVFIEINWLYTTEICSFLQIHYLHWKETVALKHQIANLCEMLKKLWSRDFP